MGSIDISLSRQLKPGHKLSPKALLGTNLLFVPLNELAAECRNILGDNPFFSFIPPKWQSSYVDIDMLDADSIPAKTGIEEHLSLQIATCPGLCGNNGPASSASFWCSALDTRGFLNTAVEDIALMLGITNKRASGYIKALQDYVEPPGLFAADLKECLLIQLARCGMEGSPAWRLLTDGIEYIISGRTKEFAEKNGWNSTAAAEAMEALKRLDPSPGKNFSPARNIVPEIEFLVDTPVPRPRLIRENIPAIENSLSEFPMGIREVLAQQWMKPAWSRTKFTLTRLGMRYRTLIRISMCIAAVQSDYLRGEKMAVAPLTYGYAAGELGLSTSTVFRSMKDTWCLVSGKVLQMSAFFSRGLHSRPDMSVHELNLAIGQLNMEGCSDRMIAEKLSMPVRTVAHHRKKLGLSSVFRSQKAVRRK